MADLYKTLGVTRRATADRITAAYRKLAMKYHADRNPSDAKAAAKFQAVSDAYEVLNDPVRRAQYDATGEVTVVRASQMFTEIMSILAPCYLSVLETMVGQRRDVKKENLVEHMRTTLIGHVRELQDAIVAQEKIKAAIETTLTRITVAEGEDDLLSGAARMHVKHIAARVAGMTAESERTQKAIDYLKVCRYTTDKAAQPDFNSIFGAVRQIKWEVQ